MTSPDESRLNKPSAVSQPTESSPPFWLGPVRFIFQLVRIVVVVAVVLGTKAAMRENGPAAGFVVLAGILALSLLTWLISKGLAMLAADSARETPSARWPALS